MFSPQEEAALAVTTRGQRTDNGTPQEKLNGLISAILEGSPCTNFPERIGAMARDPRISEKQFRDLAIVWSQEDLTLARTLEKRRQWSLW